MEEKLNAKEEEINQNKTKIKKPKQNLNIKNNSLQDTVDKMIKMNLKSKEKEDCTDIQINNIIEKSKLSNISSKNV